MKKTIVRFMVAAAVAVAFVGCTSLKSSSGTDGASGREASGSSSSGSSGSTSSSSGSSSSGSASGSSTQIANPYVETATVEQASNIAGFPITLPQVLPFNYSTQTNRAIRDSLIEIVYNSSLAGDVRFRKAKLDSSLATAAAEASADGTVDISGDYNKYLITKNRVLDDIRVQLRGASATDYRVATWVDGDYAYSVTSEKGLTEDSMVSIVRSLR